MSKNSRKIGVRRKDLERLRTLKKELEYLESREPVHEEVIIFYKDYKHNPKGTPKTDVGIDDGSEDMKRILELMKRKRTEKLQLIRKVEEWIESIEDPEMRIIIRMFYSDGMSQAEIGRALGYSAEGVKKKLFRFWNENPDAETKK